ncbi:MAG: baseplate J/gp47 family protein [bacterium]|nr:baseplate J/gp47 family protein [bacterium]
MPFNRPTLPELRERILADLTSRLELKGGIMRRSVAGVLSTVFAGVSHLLHGHLDWICKQLFVLTAQGEYLEYMHAGVHGVTRKRASAAAGFATFTGASGAVVPEGSILKRPADGALFVTTADGLVSVPVEAQAAGNSGNCDAGAVLTLVSPVSGVRNDAVVDAGGITGGSDTEGDEALRGRVLQVIQNPAMGGASHDYVRWALEVPGVTRAWCFPEWQGLGTVGVTFVRDNDSSFIPDSGEVELVQTYIDARRPVTAHVSVFAPKEKSVNFELIVSPDTAAVRQALMEEIAAFFVREAEPGGTIYLSRVSEAISSVLTEVHHRIIWPQNDVGCLNDEIAIPGTVTFNEP